MQEWRNRKGILIDARENKDLVDCLSAYSPHRSIHYKLISFMGICLARYLISHVVILDSPKTFHNKVEGQTKYAQADDQHNQQLLNHPGRAPHPV